MSGMIGVLSGLFGFGAIAFLIAAIPLSYRIEARSKPRRKVLGLPGYTNIWAVALNIGVARDPETQTLRRRMLIRMAGVAAMMAGLVIVSLMARSAT